MTLKPDGDIIKSEMILVLFSQTHNMALTRLLAAYVQTILIGFNSGH